MASRIGFILDRVGVTIFIIILLLLFFFLNEHIQSKLL